MQEFCRKFNLRRAFAAGMKACSASSRGPVIQEMRPIGELSRDDSGSRVSRRLILPLGELTPSIGRSVLKLVAGVIAHFPLGFVVSKLCQRLGGNSLTSVHRVAVVF